MTGREGADRVAGCAQDAELDPWLLVAEGDEASLFGYALRHPVTGGLAWTLSTPVRTLDARNGRALTRSGRCYALGQRVDVPSLPDEEARIAYALLASPILGVDPRDLLGGLNPGLAADWVRACKAARHLGIAPPRRDAIAVAQFLAAYGDRYAAVMRAKRGA